MKFLIGIILSMLLGCYNGSRTIGERLIKEEILDITMTDDGYCAYKIHPNSNHTEYITEACGKYQIGDSLYRVELYRIEK